MYKVKVLRLDIDACHDFSLGRFLKTGKRRVCVGKKEKEGWS